MTDIDCHNVMKRFHAEEVTLSRQQQGEMRDRRNSGRTRLVNGLKKLGHPSFQELASQGSYAMRTMTQDQENEYDIDDGVYFPNDDLMNEEGRPISPESARELVCDALKQDNRLGKPAEVKPNCVRQEYPSGYHIDLPVYRIIQIQDGQKDQTPMYELASGDEWVESDARAVTRWFNGIVGELNEGEEDGSQMRRVTKLTKKFARRMDWKSKTTSGICITKLVVDNFVAIEGRDDKSLRETWININGALDTSTAIRHPVLNDNLADEGDEEVQFFHEKLQWALSELEKFDDSNCTQDVARKVWDEVFDTTFFTNQPGGGNRDEGDKSTIQVISDEASRRRDDGGRFG
ncbi:MAG: cyclic GMP-AMP synthase DncV-like nucleotidyltransferase [Halothiobacillus sp.]|jgi:hypothetical protein